VNYETSITTSASPSAVWATLTDIERWPDWIACYQTVRRLDDGALSLGSQARIKQAGIRPATWTVTELDPGQRFVWESAAPGVRTSAYHAITIDGSGTTELRLGINQHGPLSGIVAGLLGRKIRRYIDSEADGFKTASEASRP
jgi:uncharacterized membrane protein